MRFRTVILSSGKTAAGIEVPAAVVESLGRGKKPPVTVKINSGHTYRSTVAVMGGVFMLGISAENRAAAGVAAGDEIDVDIELDTAPREVTLPADFAEALKQDPEAQRFFDSLNFSSRQRNVIAIEVIKSAEARARRIASTVTRLHEGRP